MRKQNAMTTIREPYLFISYSHADATFAEQFSLRLQQDRIPHFRDTSAIEWGESIPERIHSALEKATHLVVLISPGSEKSQWVAYEMGYARGRQVTLVPYLLHPSMTVPGFIANLRYLKDSHDETEFRASLRRMLQKSKRLQKSDGERAHISAQSSTAAADKKLLIRLACSTNPATQKQAIEPAVRLRKKAIPILHELLDHRRLHAVITAYNLLGEIADESSLPYLQAGLYPQRTSAKPRFPTAEYAAKALLQYSTDARSRVLSTITDQVRAQDISVVIQGMDHDAVYNHLLRLYREDKFYREWGAQEGLALLLQVDEERSWPLVEGLMSKSESFYSFAVFRYIYPYVSMARRQELIDFF
jgi:hypothetical protein